MSTATHVTPEELLRLPDGDRYELVHGELRELNPGFESATIGGLVSFFLQQFCMTNVIGQATCAAGYCCFPDEPNKVRRPDASFISFNRLPANQPLPRSYCRVAPELAVEVVSPNDLDEEVHVKKREYLDAGVLLVWIVRPLTETVTVYRADGTVTEFDRDDELDGEGVLPGFRCPVASIFPLPRPTP